MISCRAWVLLASLSILGLQAPAARAATPSSGWRIQGLAQETNFSASRNSECSDLGLGGVATPALSTVYCERIQITARNEGTLSTDGSQIDIKASLPPGLTPVIVTSGEIMQPNQGIGPAVSLTCEVATVTCTTSEVIAPGQPLVMQIGVEVAPSVSEGTALNARVSVGGGGAPTVTGNTPIRVSSDRPRLSIEQFSLYVNGDDGADDVQSGGHPNSTTTSFALSQTVIYQPTPPYSARLNGPFEAGEALKAVGVTLPIGLVGNPQAVPPCPIYGAAGFIGGGGCPKSSQIGVVGFTNEGSWSPGAQQLPLFNLIPERGYAAEFGFEYFGYEVILYGEVVHTSGGYGLRVTSPGIIRLPGLIEPQQLMVTFFGNPGEVDGNPAPHIPFLSNPTNCASGTLSPAIWANSWQTPSRYVTSEYPTYPDGVSGCDDLSFHPAITVTPSSAQADSPTSLSVDVAVPQNEELEGLSTPPVRKITVALPKGLAISPSSVDGLAACQAEGPEGINVGSSDISPEGQDLGDPEATELGTGYLPGDESPYEDGVWHTAPGHCPEASQIGTVEVETPLLDHSLPGRVFLASPECSPCSNADAASGKLLKLYIEVNDRESGAILKLPGSVAADPASGQLTATFDGLPQLPFSEFKLHLKEGPRAPLRTPTTCGTYGTSTDLEPWSSPETPDATPGDSFQVASAPGGGACASSESSLPAGRSFQAGTTTPTAGAYSPFVLNVSREDGSQQISTINATLPEGLLGRLAGIPYCSDVAIAAAGGRSGKAEKEGPSCPGASEVGTVDVAAGPGSKPYHVAGRVYLAGPYRGAPVSLAIITPAVAGPFDLGTVVVRTALNVDPITAQIKAVSDPIPQILAGIPLDVRSISVDLSRPTFTLNPTSCDPSAILATAPSPAGASASLSSRFQVGGCENLGFKPKLQVRLKGGTKRTGHPALKAVVTYPKQGTYANIRRAQVNLPHSEFLDQGNLNQTCTRPVLLEGKCPAKTVYGKAKVRTPLLDKPLEGNVYLVGGFGYKLPALVAELKGQIRFLLVGKIDTGKNHGIRATFESVPDAPVEQFTLEMKGGKKYGLLENSEDLCRKAQRAPTRFVAQSGKAVSSKTRISNDCKRKRPPAK